MRLSQHEVGLSIPRNTCRHLSSPPFCPHTFSLLPCRASQGHHPIRRYTQYLDEQRVLSELLPSPALREKRLPCSVRVLNIFLIVQCPLMLMETLQIPFSQTGTSMYTDIHRLCGEQKTLLKPDRLPCAPVIGKGACETHPRLVLVFDSRGLSAADRLVMIPYLRCGISHEFAERLLLTRNQAFHLAVLASRVLPQVGSRSLCPFFSQHGYLLKRHYATLRDKRQACRSTQHKISSWIAGSTIRRAVALPFHHGLDGMIRQVYYCRVPSTDL